VRRGRKARDLLVTPEAARLPIRRRHPLLRRYETVKANLARFTLAITLLASIAMSAGAGIRW
jgi:hypothetical protein